MGIRERAKAPTSIPAVGVTAVIKPVAAWYEVTSTLPSTWAKWASDPMMPIVAAAKPELEGIRKDRIIKKIKAKMIKAAFGIPLNDNSPQ